MVLGGYPTDSKFDSYMADTTALLITFPVNAEPALRAQAVGWERELLRTVRRHMRMCATACQHRRQGPFRGHGTGDRR